MTVSTFKLLYLQFLVEFGNSLIVKDNLDHKTYNEAFVSTIATVFSVDETSCSYKCDKVSDGKSNMRVYRDCSQTCICYQATVDFQDTRKAAPELRDGETTKVNCKLLCDAMMHVLKDSINLKYSELLTKVISKCNLI